MGGAPVSIAELGRTRYESVHEIQRSLQTARIEGATGDWLLINEHEPVLTLGRAHTTPDLRVARSVVEGLGIPVVATERGGDITYHGPGQIVVYGVVDLRARGIGVVDYVTGLERAIVATLEGCGIEAGGRPDARGVWLGDRKIASIGINVRRGVTMHGLALNVEPNMEHFELINPCGMTGVTMTSMARELGRSIAMAEVEPVLVGAILDGFGWAGTQVPAGDAERIAGAGFASRG